MFQEGLAEVAMNRRAGACRAHAFQALTTWRRPFPSADGILSSPCGARQVFGRPAHSGREGRTSIQFPLVLKAALALKRQSLSLGPGQAAWGTREEAGASS